MRPPMTPRPIAGEDRVRDVAVTAMSIAALVVIIAVAAVVVSLLAWAVVAIWAQIGAVR